MNDDPFVTRLRADLLHGAARRRRHERRRAVVLTATPLLLAIVAAGALLFGRAPQDDVTTEGGPSAEVVEACNALLELQAAQQILDEDELAAARARYAVAAERTDDGTLRALVEPLKAMPLSPMAEVDDDIFHAYIDASLAAQERCRELTAPGWVPTFVPATLGPEPTVDLTAYGVVVGWRAIDGDADVPSHLERIAGLGLSPVRAARTGAGAYVARWTTVDRNGRTTHHYREGDIDGGYSGGTAPRAFAGELSVELSGAPDREGTHAYWVSDRTSFVVIDIAGETWAQRPAEGVAMFTGFDPGEEDAVTARSYTADGTEIACLHRPAVGWTDAPCN